MHSNVLVEYSQQLWSKPQSLDWAELGDGEFPFKIIIPEDTPGYSHTNFQDYRVYWKIDAGNSLFPRFISSSPRTPHFSTPLSLQTDLSAQSSTTCHYLGWAYEK